MTATDLTRRIAAEMLDQMVGRFRRHLEVTEAVVTDAERQLLEAELARDIALRDLLAAQLIWDTCEVAR